MSNLWVLRDAGAEWEIERPATSADLLSAVRSLEGVWPIELTEPWSYTAPGGKHGVGFAPGRYLVVPLGLEEEN